MFMVDAILYLLPHCHPGKTLTLLSYIPLH